MKAAVYVKPGDIQIIEVPMPEYSPNGVLMKVRSCSICGSDVSTYKYGGNWSDVGIPVDEGIILGHEIAGEIVEIGSQVTDHKIGDRLILQTMGGYAEYLTVEPGYAGSQPFKMPSNISFEEASTVEPMAVSYAAIQRAEPKETDVVLIIGAGTVGLGCLQVLKAEFPVAKILVADTSEKRLAVAAELGADVIINAKKESLADRAAEIAGDESVWFLDHTATSVDIVLECAGASVTLQQAIEIVKPVTGRVVLVALYHEQVPIDPNYIVLKNIMVRGAMPTTNIEFNHCAELVASGKVNRAPLISHRFSLDEIVKAFEVQSNPDESVKVVVIP